MKKLYALLASVLALTQLVCIGGNVPISAHADDSDTTLSESECKGDPGYGISNIPLEQQLEEFLEDPELTEDEKRAAKEKIEIAISFRDSATADKAVSNNQRSSYSTVTLSVPAYTQENEFYCGPATTRQTLGYLGKAVPGYNPPIQSAIAEELKTTKKDGTEWENITKYINSFTFMGIRYNYISYVPTNKSNMESVINYALTKTRPTPPILHINTNGNTTVLGYKTDGHYMNVSGIKTVNGTNYFQVTDPNRGRLPNPLSAKYDITTSKAYEFTQNHWAKHFMY